jgi:SHS2 domain-containing protein
LVRSSYRYLPDVALADVAFRARGDSAESLFEACARALTEVMVDRRSVAGRVVKEVEIDSDGLDGLLYDLLSQLIFVKDVDSLLFKTFEVSISKDRKHLKCRMKGEPIDRARHKLRNDVKAVTMNLFGVKKAGRGWEATVVLDI